MRFPYLQDRAKNPQVSLHGGVNRPRPVLAVRLTGPGGSYLLDGHLDTAADDTVFPLWLAPFLGMDLSQAVEQEVHLAGRPQRFRARFAAVDVSLTDGRETCRWSALVGFVPISLRRGLLGYAGFLQFFDANFRGAAQEVLLDPNAAFQGHRS